MRETGIVISGIFAVFVGVMGLFFLGMTGVVWDNGQFKTTSSYDPFEAQIGIVAMAILLFLCAVVLVLVTFLSLKQARTRPEKKVRFRLLAWLVPLAVIATLAVLWPILLGPAGAGFAP